MRGARIVHTHTVLDRSSVTGGVLTSLIPRLRPRRTRADTKGLTCARAGLRRHDREQKPGCRGGTSSAAACEPAGAPARKRRGSPADQTASRWCHAAAVSPMCWARKATRALPSASPAAPTKAPDNFPTPPASQFLSHSVSFPSILPMLPLPYSRPGRNFGGGMNRWADLRLTCSTVRCDAPADSRRPAGGGGVASAPNSGVTVRLRAAHSTPTPVCLAQFLVGDNMSQPRATVSPPQFLSGGR